MIFFVLLILALVLVVQLAWIGIQKWQFNYFALYSARVWSVEKTHNDPEYSLLKVQAAQALRWGLDSNRIKFMWVQFPEDTKDYDDPGITANGITYWGVAPLFALYRDRFGETLIEGSFLTEALSRFIFDRPTTGYVGFATFIPIQKEPEEKPGEFDNDCKETPCASGNKE